MPKETKLETWKRYQHTNGHTNGHQAGYVMETNGHHPERDIPPQYQGVVVTLPADVQRMLAYGWS